MYKGDSKETPSIVSWAESELADPRGFAEFADLRRSVERQSSAVDEIATSLALQRPYQEVTALARAGHLTYPLFASQIDTMISAHLEEADFLFGVALENEFSPSYKRASWGDLYGYFGEVSFHLLMLHAAKTRRLITLKSSMTSNGLPGEKISKAGNHHYDAVVYSDVCKAKGWQRVQIKASRAIPEKYKPNITVIKPPVLPIWQDELTRLPVNVFLDFFDIYSGEPDPNQPEIRLRLNRAAAKLAKVFESN